MEQIARTPQQLGNALRRQRRKLGLNQAALGEKTSLRQATVSEVESGAPGAQLRTIFDLMSALDLEFVVRVRSSSYVDEDV